MSTKYGNKNMSVKNVSAKCGNHLMDPFNFPLNEKVVQGWLWLQHNFEEMCGNRHPLYYLPSLPIVSSGGQRLQLFPTEISHDLFPGQKETNRLKWLSGQFI